MIPEQVIKIPAKNGFVPGIKARLMLLPVGSVNPSSKYGKYSLKIDGFRFYPLLVTDDPLHETDKALHHPTFTMVVIWELKKDIVSDNENINGRYEDYIKVLGVAEQFSKKHRKAIKAKQLTEGTDVIVECTEVHRHGHHFFSMDKPYFPANPGMFDVFYVTWTKPCLTLYRFEITVDRQGNMPLIMI